MSLPLTPLSRWDSGTNQNSIPANDNSLRVEIFNTDGIADDVTAQPGSPADGDWYIIPAGATGAQWATFAEDSIAIFYGGTWYEFVPGEGAVVTLSGVLMIYSGTGGWEPMMVPSAGVPTGGTAGQVLSKIDGTNFNTEWKTPSNIVSVNRPIIAETGSSRTVTPADAGAWILFTGTGAKTVTFDEVEGIDIPEEYWIRNGSSSGDITFTFTAISPRWPPGGAVTLAPGQTAMVKMRSDSDCDVVVFGGSGGSAASQSIPIACSDETTDLTTGTAKVTFRMPYAFTVTEVRASLTTAQASGSIFTVDINEGGTSILSTKLTIDNTEKSSTTASTPAVVSDAALADDAEITVDIDQVGAAGAKGLKVYLIGYPA